jgi:hypothetical protein
MCNLCARRNGFVLARGMDFRVMELNVTRRHGQHTKWFGCCERYPVQSPKTERIKDDSDQELDHGHIVLTPSRSKQHMYLCERERMVTLHRQDAHKMANNVVASIVGPSHPCLRIPDHPGRCIFHHNFVFTVKRSFVTTAPEPHQVVAAASCKSTDVNSSLIISNIQNSNASLD